MTGQAHSNGDKGASPRRTNILAILVLVIALLGVALWKLGDDPGRTTHGAGPAAQTADDEARATRLTEVVSKLGSAWRERDREQFIRAAGGSDTARDWAQQTYDNLAALHVARFSARFIAENAKGIRPNGTFVADVNVAWKPAPSSTLDATRTSPVTVGMVFRPSARGYDIEGVRPAGDPLPLWLAGDLRVRRRHHAEVVVVGADGPGSRRLRASSVMAMSRRARRDVQAVMGSDAGPAVVVVPRDARRAAALAGQRDLGQIAAVTTTADGSTTADVASYVVLNPAVFAGLNKRAAQLVLSHEVTHELTDAPGSGMPLWVAEGFADYVALHDSDRSVEENASQILDRVRRKDAPRHLPSAHDFEASRHGLGATYESAWLVFELLHLRAPDEQIVGFYTAVRDGAGVGHALEAHFGLDVDGLTSLWREYLHELART